MNNGAYAGLVVFVNGREICDTYEGDLPDLTFIFCGVDD